MKQFDERLQELQMQIGRKKQLEAQLSDLERQNEEVKAKVQQLRESANSEQYDVTELEGMSFASIWARISGSYDEKLRQEKQEAFAAAAKYESALREQQYVQSDYLRMKEQLRSLQAVEEEYRKVLHEKQEALAASGDETAKEILELEKKLAYLSGQKRELDEAYQAGRSAMNVANRIADSLASADSWATWDLFGGGIIADVIKHGHMNDAQQEIETLQKALRRFRTELADVKIDDHLDFQMDGFTSFGDYFFDGLIFDWMAKNHINRSAQQIQNTRSQIGMAISKLQDLQEALDAEIAEVKGQLEAVVSRA